MTRATPSSARDGSTGGRDVVRVPLPNWFGYALAGVALVALLLIPVWLSATGTSAGEAVATWSVQSLAPLGVLGAFILRHRRGHPIGWLLIAAATCDALTYLATYYVDFGMAARAAILPDVSLTPVTDGMWVITVALITMGLPQLFPTGRPLSRRWIPLGIATSAVALALFVVFAAGRYADPVVVGVIFPLYGLSMLASLVPLCLRFRRSRGEERQQFKWVLAGLAVSAPMVILGTIGVEIWGTSPVWLLPVLIVFPASITVAVVRYRLYDIDVVISKALVAAVLAAFIAGVYVAVVVGLGTLIGVGDDAAPVLSIAATALVAVAFQPARRVLQRAASRIVFGRRATPYDVLSGFARRVAAVATSPSALIDLAALLAEGTGANPARVWLRVGSELRPAATWPESRTDGPGDPDAPEARLLQELEQLPDADHVEAVHHDGELLGALTIAKPRGERVSEADAHLLRSLVASSGVLLRNLQLDAELAQRLDDLDASRRRLVAVQDEARRRIEQSLQTGARRELEALQDDLAGLAGQVEAADAPKTAMLLGQLQEAARAAAATLDALAAGVYPPSLEARGLAAALAEQAARSAVPTTVHASAIGRHDGDIEAAVYFAVLEALQNAAKYAQATSVHVQLRVADGALTFTVTDDGVGFDLATASGSGLPGIADRLDTVGGHLVVESTPGAGTTVRGTVPLRPARYRPTALVGAPA